MLNCCQAVPAFSSGARRGVPAQVTLRRRMSAEVQIRPHLSRGIWQVIRQPPPQPFPSVFQLTRSRVCIMVCACALFPRLRPLTCTWESKQTSAAARPLFPFFTFHPHKLLICPAAILAPAL